MHIARARAALVAALLISASRTYAQSATAGSPVAGTHLAAESQASVLPDGAGGSYIGFKIAYRDLAHPAEIAVAHVTASAGFDPNWEALPIFPNGSLPQKAPPGPSRVLRATGGNVLVFADFSSTSNPKDLLRQVDATGATPGYPEFHPTYSYNVMNVVPRSDGGALILSKAAITGPTGSVPNVLATAVTAAGTATEVLTTLTISSGFTLGGDQLAAVPSGVNGGIAVLQEPFVGGSTGVDLIAVRVDAAGNPVWSPAHRVVASAVNDQRDQVAISDGADGVIAAWDDGRLGTAPDIFATRILASGAIAPGWVSGGKTISNITGTQFLPAIATDDAGGVWIAWQDDRNSVTAGQDVYFTHVLANGTYATGFNTNGRALCGADGDQLGVQLARDGSGGLFAVWLDSRDGEQDLYATHVDAAGNPTAGWAATGTAVCTDGTPQNAPAIGLVSSGRAIVAWNDSRTGSEVVYAVALDVVQGVVVLDVPRVGATHLALAAGANPSHGGIELRLDAADAGDVRVTLYDVAGRVQAERTVSGPARSAALRFEGLRPGLYLARATQAGVSTNTRIAVLE